MKKITGFFVSLFLVLAGASQAGAIEVLWYGGSSSYNTSMAGLSGVAATYDPWGDGNLSWNMSFWNAGDATPDFSQYDVFVIGSPDYGFSTGMDPARLLASKDAISSARGSRTFLSGQDADWHAQYSEPGAVGFVIDAINWAASGTGLGIVSMTDGWSGSGSMWWLDDDSFLKAELDGYVSYFQEESVVIPSGMETFPVNEGLTTASLSNWGTSAHAGFDKTMPGYTSINDAGSHPGWAVTIVTAGYEGGDTSGGDDDNNEVPEPATMVLFGTGLASLAAARRRRKAS
ncbi:PEP-CTERM sorting domain-containing protein [Thiovibrio sp. JS02]